jgi:hypothetical protein
MNRRTCRLLRFLVFGDGKVARRIIDGPGMSINKDGNTKFLAYL